MSADYITVQCPHCYEEHRVDIGGLRPNPADEDRFYTVTATAKMMGVSRLTVKKWIYTKKLHAIRLPGRTTPWRISAAALEDFKKQHRTHKPS